MRIWHWQLLPYLPDRQFRGQLRELVAIMRDWRDKGKTNHLLINHVMDYPKSDLLLYFNMYRAEYDKRYKGKNGIRLSIISEFCKFGEVDDRNRDNPPFKDWHDDEYLLICMWNLYEKFLAVGNSAVTYEEWLVLRTGYKTITGKDF